MYQTPKADPKPQGGTTARKPEPTPCHRGGGGEPLQADPQPDQTTPQPQGRGVARGGRGDGEGRGGGRGVRGRAGREGGGRGGRGRVRGRVQGFEIIQIIKIGRF